MERFVNIVLKSKAEEINKTDNHFFSFLTSPPPPYPNSISEVPLHFQRKKSDKKGISHYNINT